MSKSSRSEEILQLVNSQGVISVGELSEKTYASRSTIRRDLEKLEQQGLLRRHHGGAESVLSLRPPQIIRRQRNQSEKTPSHQGRRRWSKRATRYLSMPPRRCSI